MLQRLGLGSRVRVGFRVGVTESNTHTHTHTHTQHTHNTQLASHPSGHTRFKTYIDSTGLAAIKDGEQIAIHVPCQRKHTKLGQMVLILALFI